MKEETAVILSGQLRAHIMPEIDEIGFTKSNIQSSIDGLTFEDFKRISFVFNQIFPSTPHPSSDVEEAANRLLHINNDKPLSEADIDEIKEIMDSADKRSILDQEAIKLGYNSFKDLYLNPKQDMDFQHLIWCIEKSMDNLSAHITHPDKNNSLFTTKNLPKKIYLCIGDDLPDDFKELNEVTWCADRINKNDIEYVLSCASFQSGGVGKTLQECKDEVAKENLYNSFEEALQYHMDEFNPSFALKKSLSDLFDEANKRFYAQSNQVKEGEGLDPEEIFNAGMMYANYLHKYTDYPHDSVHESDKVKNALDFTEFEKSRL